MPDTHTVRATAAAHPQVGTSREPTEVKKLSNPTAAVTRSGSVRICCALRWLSHMKRFQTSHFDSCVSSGWEKFSPRRIMSGPSGEGLSGPSITSPRTRGVRDDSGGQLWAPWLRKETDFLWIITILETQPRVRSPRRGSKVYLRAVGRLLKKRKYFTPQFEQKQNFWLILSSDEPAVVRVHRCLTAQQVINRTWSAWARTHAGLDRLLKTTRWRMWLERIVFNTQTKTSSIHHEGADFFVHNCATVGILREQPKLPGSDCWQLSLLGGEVQQRAEQAARQDQGNVWWCGPDGHPAAQLPAQQNRYPVSRFHWRLLEEKVRLMSFSSKPI